MRSALFGLTMLLIIVKSIAQIEIDSSKNTSTEKPKPNILERSKSWDDPKKAMALALILPGVGQVYNKKYWKAGLVYGGAIGIAYLYKLNVDSLNKYQSILTAKIDDDPNTIDLYPSTSETSIKNFRDFHRRNRDIAILSFVGLYAIQIIDANVDAHLKEFRVNKDLSLKISPNLYSYKPGLGYYTGASVNIKF